MYTFWNRMQNGHGGPQNGGKRLHPHMTVKILPLFRGSGDHNKILSEKKVRKNIGVRRSGLGKNIGSAWILYRGGSAGKILFAQFLAEFKGFYVFQVLLICVWPFLGHNKCQMCANSTKKSKKWGGGDLKKRKKFNRPEVYIPLPLEWSGEKKCC